MKDFTKRIAKLHAKSSRIFIQVLLPQFHEKQTTIIHETIHEMNNRRRRQIEKLAEELEIIGQSITELAEEEQDAFENLPESLQESERGTEMEEKAGRLNEFAEMIEELMNEISQEDW